MRERVRVRRAPVRLEWVVRDVTVEVAQQYQTEEGLFAALETGEFFIDPGYLHALALAHNQAMHAGNGNTEKVPLLKDTYIVKPEACCFGHQLFLNSRRLKGKNCALCGADARRGHPPNKSTRSAAMSVAATFGIPVPEVPKLDRRKPQTKEDRRQARSEAEKQPLLVQSEPARPAPAAAASQGTPTLSPRPAPADASLQGTPTLSPSTAPQQSRSTVTILVAPPSPVLEAVPSGPPPIDHPLAKPGPAVSPAAPWAQKPPRAALGGGAPAPAPAADVAPAPSAPPLMIELTDLSKPQKPRPMGTLPDATRKGGPRQTGSAPPGSPQSAAHSPSMTADYLPFTGELAGLGDFVLDIAPPASKSLPGVVGTQTESAEPPPGLDGYSITAQDAREVMQRVYLDAGIRLPLSAEPGDGPVLSASNVDVRYSTLSYTCERRLVVNRAVKETKQDLVICSVRAFPRPNPPLWPFAIAVFLLLSLLVAVLAGSSPFILMAASTIALLSLAVATYHHCSYSRISPKSLYFAPHAVSSVYQDFDRDVNEVTARAAVRQKFRRLGTLPIPDVDHVLLMDGTERVVLNMLRKADFSGASLAMTLTPIRIPLAGRYTHQVSGSVRRW